jgi:bifunctional UDP-N-acetylglucosamine pyrophosphorylase/glucosamine-1-phosphate N-acetyltransferase
MNKIIILAAGKGTRMNADVPKVLVPLLERPMIMYLLDSIKTAGVDATPTLIVSPDNQEIIREHLAGYEFQTAIQEQQLGTGHAVASGLKDLDAGIENIIVFYGDHPFVQAETIERLAVAHKESDAPITMMTTTVDSFEGWQQNFKSWGRIIRDEQKNIQAIVEFKDATGQQQAITEVNPGFYCFNRAWLDENISRLQNNNNQQEYYLTDLIGLATEQGHIIHDLAVETWETMGINSPEELALATAIYQEKNT